ncbi:TonB-dependent receptor [Flavobacteriaceae bacterium]|nr:TonB-dependent receptor [Flavobacteriaceae bacterium]
MKNLQLIFFGMLFLISSSMFAQQTATGSVTDKTTGEPLPGVGILIKGTTKGGITDFEGGFVIDNVETGSTLIFSYMGFKTQELVFDGSSLDVALEEDAAMLDEVLVVGYGTARKKDLTGSVELMTDKDFNEGPAANAAQLIQGKVAGVQISTGNGAPGAGQQIRIRGTGSLNVSSNPLIVVDGVPLSDNNVGGSRNVLNTINPNDIASMSILKDASSTAIYGSRAANGVILITTKKGKLDQELKVNFSSITGVSVVNNYVNSMTADEFSYVINEIDNARGSDFSSMLGGANTNWQEVIYQNAMNFDNNLSISGNLGSIPFRLSAGYTATEGVLKTDQFNRTTAKLNLTPSLLDDRLKFDINVNGSFIDNQFADNGAIGSAVIYDPTQPIYDETSPYGGFSYWRNDPSDPNSTRANLAAVNPLAMLELKDDSSKVNRIISNIKADYQFGFLPELTATVNAGYDYTFGKGSIFVSKDMPDARANWDGYESNYENSATNQLLDFYLNYVDNESENHDFGTMLGYSYQSFENESTSTVTKDPSNNPDLIDVPFIDKERSTLVSFFGRANYGYKDKYLVTATVRADASSKLNPDDRWGIFPSVALAWNLSNEDFLVESEVINNLKVRFGYGEVGNVNGLGNYGFLTRYTGNQSGAFYGFGDNYYPTYRPEEINPNLRWEIGNTLNLGLDYSLFDSRVFGSIDVYNKRTQDLIATSIVDPFTNFANTISDNIGDMENKGIEVALNVIPVRTDSFEWTINANLSYNQNTLTKLPNPQPTGGISGGTGNNVQRHEVGQTPFAFYVYEQVYDESQNPVEGVFVDRNKDGVITEEDKYFYKDPYADMVIGLNTNMTLGNFDFAFASRLSLGNYVYNNVASDKGFADRAVSTANTLNNLNQNFFETQFLINDTKTLLSDYYVQDASFYRIDNITLGYNLPADLIEGVGMRIYGSANNVLLVSEYEGLDPEIPGGIDNNFYPRPQIYSVGLNINF